MKNLITIENGTPILAPEAVQKIVEFERMAKDIKEKETELKNAILEAMEAEGIIKIDADDVIISYVAPTDRESLDTKALRAELPDIYDAYVKISPVKASIRVKLR